MWILSFVSALYIYWAFTYWRLPGVHGQNQLEAVNPEGGGGVESELKQQLGQTMDDTAWHPHDALRRTVSSNSNCEGTCFMQLDIKSD